jgi:hypothetical protein
MGKSMKRTPMLSGIVLGEVTMSKRTEDAKSDRTVCSSVPLKSAEYPNTAGVEPMRSGAR